MENEPESQAGDREFEPRLMEMEKLLLASASPRRAEILRNVGWPFDARPVDVDESRRASESASDFVERLAREKAEAAASLCAQSGVLALGADTIVACGEEVFGKPRDAEDARRMLRLLSNRWHEVLTGVALVRVGETSHCLTAHEKTRVRFAEMADAEINWYVATGEPAGKAGAYAVQGRAALFIEEIAGDYWNVVGLPVHLLYKLVREI